MANQYFPSQLKQYENIAENVALNRGRDPDTVVNPLESKNQIKMDRNINIPTPDLSFNLGDFSAYTEDTSTPSIPTGSLYPKDFTSSPFGIEPEPDIDPEEEYKGFWQFNVNPREAKNILIGGGLGQWYSMKTGLRNVLGISPDIGQRQIEEMNVNHFLNDISDNAKESLQKDFIYKDKETGEFHVGGDLTTLLGAVLQSGPGTLLTLMAGGVGGLLLKRFAGMSANAAGALAFGTSSGMTSGLSQAGNVYNSVIDLPMESVEKSPLFQKIYDRVLFEKPDESPEYVKEFAKDFLAKQLSFEAGLVTGSLTAVTEAAIGGVLLRGTENAIDLTRRMFGMNGIAAGNGMQLIGKIAKGSGIEGIMESFQNSFLEGVVNRYQRHRAGEDIEPYDGVWNDAATGLLTGATMAGAATSITGGIAMSFQVNKKDMLDSVMTAETKSRSVVEKLGLDGIDLDTGLSELNREVVQPIKDFVYSISDRLPATTKNLKVIKDKFNEAINDINLPESVSKGYSDFKSQIENALHSKEYNKKIMEIRNELDEMEETSPNFEIIEEGPESTSSSKFIIMDNTGDTPRLVRRAITKGEAEQNIEELDIQYNTDGKDFFSTPSSVPAIPEDSGAKLRDKRDVNGKNIIGTLVDKLFKKSSFTDTDKSGSPIAIKEFLKEMHGLIVREDMYMNKLVAGSVKEEAPHIINLRDVQNVRTLIHEVGHSILISNKMIGQEVKEYFDSVTIESINAIEHLIPSSTIKYLRDQLMENKYNWFNAHVNTKKSIIKNELGLVPKKKAEWSEVQENGKTYEEMIMQELWNKNRSTNKKFINEFFAQFYSAYVFNPTWTRATFPQFSSSFNRYLNRTNIEGGKVNYKLQELTDELIKSVKIWNNKSDAERVRAKIGDLSKAEKRAIAYPEGVSFKTLGKMLGLTKKNADALKTRYQNWWHPVTLMYKDLAFEEVIGADGKSKMVEKKLFSVLKDPRRIFQLLAGDGKEIETGVMHTVAPFDRYKFWDTANDPELLKTRQGLAPILKPLIDIGADTYNSWKQWITMVRAEELALFSKEKLFEQKERNAIYKEIGVYPKKERIGQYAEVATGKIVPRELVDEVYADGEFSHNDSKYTFRGKTIMARDENGRQAFVIDSSQQFNRDEQLLFIEQHRQLMQFYEILADYAVDAGLLSQASRENFKMYINYIPFNRINPRTGEIDSETENIKGYGSWKSKSIVGSTNNVGDPIENTIMNYASLVHSARRNAALNSLIDFNYLMEEGNLDESGNPKVSVDPLTGKANIEEVLKDNSENKWFSVSNASEVTAYKVLTKTVLKTLRAQGLKIPDPETDQSPAEYLNAFQTFFLPNPSQDKKGRAKDEFLIKRDGKSYILKIKDELLLESLDSMYATRIDNGLIRTLFRGSKTLARLKRNSIVMEPVFQVRNFLRDTTSAYFYSDAAGEDAFSWKMFLPFISSIQGGKMVAGLNKADEAFIAMQAWGGAGFGSKVKENMIDHEDRMKELKDIHGKGTMGFYQGLHLVEKWGSFTESAARMKEFYLVLEKELSERVNAINERYSRIDKERREIYQGSPLKGKGLVTENESLRFMALNEKGQRDYEFKGQQWKDLKTGKIVPIKKVYEKAREIERLELEMYEHRVRQAKAEAIMQASLAYREVSTDFGKIGSSHNFRRYAQITNFLNPHMQGIFKFGENLLNHKKRNMLRAMPVVGATLAIHLAHKASDDEEDYSDRPNWDTLTYLNIYKFGEDDIIGSTLGALGFKHEGMLRIPKSWELGYIYQTLPQLWTDYFIEMNGENNPLKKKAIREVALAGAYSLIGDAPLPTALQPLLEVAWNRNIWLDRPIEPDYMRGTSPEKFGPSTPELFRDISRHFEGLGLNISPVQLEHLSYGYLGGLSMLMVAGVDDLFYKRETHTDSSFRDRMISPLVGKAAMSSNEVSEFYDAYRQLRDLNASLKSIKEEYPREPETVKSRVKEFQGRYPMWQYAGIISEEFRDLSKDLTKLRQEKRDYMRDSGRSSSEIDNMSNEEIKQIRRKHMDKVNDIDRAMNSMIKKIMSKYRSIKKQVDSQ